MNVDSDNFELCVRKWTANERCLRIYTAIWIERHGKQMY